MNELHRKSVTEFHEAEKTPVVLVLDNVRSLHNVGSVFRTADAFLLEGVFLCGYTGTPPHRDIHKTALGATDTVSWKYFTQTSEAVAHLRTQGYAIWAVEQTDQSVLLQHFSPPSCPVALIFGNEVAGVSEDVLKQVDGCIEIPQGGMKHSLNIAVSVGIITWDLYSKLWAGGKKAVSDRP
jgi:tRNA G18 (ribose-2'-O)-methylase SpoU